MEESFYFYVFSRTLHEKKCRSCYLILAHLRLFINLCILSINSFICCELIHIFPLSFCLFVCHNPVLLPPAHSARCCPLRHSPACRDSHAARRRAHRCRRRGPGSFESLVVCYPACAADTTSADLHGKICCRILKFSHSLGSMVQTARSWFEDNSLWCDGRTTEGRTWRGLHLCQPCCQVSAVPV